MNQSHAETKRTGCRESRVRAPQRLACELRTGGAFDRQWLVSTALRRWSRCHSYEGAAERGGVEQLVLQIQKELVLVLLFVKYV